MDMTIIEIAKLENGAHNNQTIYSGQIPVPDGWCLVPNSMLPLENYPFGDVEVEEIDGIMTLTKWTPLPIPEPPPPPPPEPSDMDKLQAQVLYTAVETNTLLIEGGPNT